MSDTAPELGKLLEMVIFQAVNRILSTYPASLRTLTATRLAALATPDCRLLFRYDFSPCEYNGR